MFKLGDKVRVKAQLKSRKLWDSKIGAQRKIYKRKEISMTGIITGVRTLKEGYTNFYVDGLVFTPIKSIKVYLVAVNLTQIIKALPEDIEKLEEV